MQQLIYCVTTVTHCPLKENLEVFNIGPKQGRSQKKIERGPNFATFNVMSFTYNGILPFVNYARRYYKNCCTKLRKCECDFTDIM